MVVCVAGRGARGCRRRRWRARSRASRARRARRARGAAAAARRAAARGGRARSPTVETSRTSSWSDFWASAAHTTPTSGASRARTSAQPWSTPASSRERSAGTQRATSARIRVDARALAANGSASCRSAASRPKRPIATIAAAASLSRSAGRFTSYARSTARSERSVLKRGGIAPSQPSCASESRQLRRLPPLKEFLLVGEREQGACGRIASDLTNFAGARQAATRCVARATTTSSSDRPRARLRFGVTLFFGGRHGWSRVARRAARRSMPPSANIASLIGARAREFPDHPFLVSWRDIASRSIPPRSFPRLCGAPTAANGRRRLASPDVLKPAGPLDARGPPARSLVAAILGSIKARWRRPRMRSALGSPPLVHALGLPLPDVGGAWAAARRAVVRRAERAPCTCCAGAGASNEQSQKLLEPPPGSPDSV